MLEKVALAFDFCHSVNRRPSSQVQGNGHRDGLKCFNDCHWGCLSFYLEKGLDKDIQPLRMQLHVVVRERSQAASFTL